MKSKFLFASGLLVGLLLIGAAPASASTFCVPTFHAGCPDSGSNVAVADLETAMSTDGNDGIADRVLVGNHTYTDTETLGPLGTDPLAVVGSGTDKTFITSSSTGNVFVVNLGTGERPTTMRNLTIVIPPSFPDSGGNGSALQSENGIFDHVNIESRNPGSNGAASLLGDNTFRDCRIFATGVGSIGTAMRPNEAFGPGELKIVRTEILDSSLGVSADSDEIPVEFRQSLISSPVASAAEVTQGGRVSFENSVVESGGYHAIYVSTSSAPGEVDAQVFVKSSTIVAKGDSTKAPIYVEIGTSLNSASAQVTVADSIIRGFNKTWDLDAPFGPGLGIVELTFTDSNFLAAGLPAVAPQVDFTDPGNIDQDPLFAGPGDYRLTAGSPSIDVAEGAGGPFVDFDGNRRPQDGDGNGIAIRDQGAFEAPDTTTPRIFWLRAKAPKKGGPRYIRVTAKMSPDDVQLIYTLTPVPKRVNGKRRKTLVLKRKGLPGKNILIVKHNKLSKGRYKIRLKAVDSGGNESAKTVRLRYRGR